MNTNEKLREALGKIENLLLDEAKWADEMTNNKAIALSIIQEALSLPRRNCDVGTAEEQYDRFLSFCKSHPINESGECEGCPLFGRCRSCHLEWAQLPYEKGENDEQK